MSGPDADALRLLRERARALAEPERPATGDLLEVLVARVGDRRVAVPLERAREVLGPGSLAWVPGAAPAVRGVRGVRGELMAVADAALLVDLGVAETAADGYVVVVDDGDGPLGLLVEGIEGVRALPPPVGHGGAAPATGLLDDGGEGIVLLDPGALLAGPRAAAPRETGPRGEQEAT